jgi:copper chaperone CopZ
VIGSPCGVAASAALQPQPRFPFNLNFIIKESTAMKKKFAIEVDCANCAAKIETAVKELPGVTNASISFMAQKMMLEADDDKFDAVLQEAVKVAKKVEPDFEIEL